MLVALPPTSVVSIIRYWHPKLLENYRPVYWASVRAARCEVVLLLDLKSARWLKNLGGIKLRTQVLPKRQKEGALGRNEINPFDSNQKIDKIVKIKLFDLSFDLTGNRNHALLPPNTKK